MHRYRSRHHPDNGVTYRVIGDRLISSGGSEYGPDCWSWDDLERIEDIPQDLATKNGG